MAGSDGGALTMAKASRTCDLCGLPVLGRGAKAPGGTQAPEGIDPASREFCCAGCARVWSVAAANGMTDLIEGPVSGRSSRDASRAKAAAAALAGARRLTLRIDGMWCSSCSMILETGLLGVDGVLDAEVSYAASLARVTYDPEHADAEAIVDRVAMLGYAAAPASDPAAVGRDPEVVETFLRFFVGIAAAMWIMWLSLFLLWPSYAVGVYSGEMLQRVELLCALLSLAVLLYPGSTFLLGAWQAARVGRVSMDTLVVLGTWTAWVYSVWASATGSGPAYFEAAATITVIVLLGRWIEALGKADATKAIEGLSDGMPEEVWLVPDGAGLSGAERAPLGSVAADMLVAVRPGERIPVDGVIVEGMTAVDQSRLTGEPLPVTRDAGDELFAGTINVGEPVVLRVTRAGDQTLAGRIASIVEDAAFAKSNVQRLTDTVAGLFVPAVVVIAMATFGITWLGAGLAAAVGRAVSVLVVSCPCALGLATPLAIVNAVSAGAKRGLLIRGGAVLERAGTLKVAAFDKTGTLTEGTPSVTAVLPAGSAAGLRAEILAVASSLELGSAHPVAHAIATAAQAAGIEVSAPDHTETRAGRGITGLVGGHVAAVGSARLLAEAGVTVPADWAVAGRRETAAGRSVVWVARDGVALGGLALADRVRPEARTAVSALKAQGLATVIVSGDSVETCDAVAAAVGVDAVRAELMPNDKEIVVRELRADGPLMFVGDGINDAPALAAADLAVAMGGASDVALAASDVVLLGEAGGGTAPLSSLGALPAIARRSQRIIHENLGWAFVYNLVAIPLAVLGLLNPIAAAVAMTASSLAVVLNSLRARHVPRSRSSSDEATRAPTPDEIEPAPATP